jgi:hypothetical protein
VSNSKPVLITPSVLSRAIDIFHRQPYVRILSTV